MTHENKKTELSKRDDGPSLAGISRLPQIRDVDGHRRRVSRWGIVQPHRIKKSDLAKPTRKGVAIAKRFFDLIDRETRIKTCDVGSYGLKHTIEREAGSYVSNGEAIVAAFLDGIRIEVSYDGLNANIGISKRWLRRREIFATRRHDRALATSVEGDDDE